MTDVYEGKKLRVMFEGDRCIHARRCVLGAPQTFIANAEGPWIQPDQTEAEELAALIRSCPSGALRFERVDGGTEEQAPAKNVVMVMENGPLAIRARMEIEGADHRAFRAVLCRCGASKHKPFCDGSHREAGFTATGEPEPAAEVGDYPATAEGLTIKASPNGPLRLTGPVEIVGASGRTVKKAAKAVLCRCGQSANKPFCDGSHLRVGFKTEEA